MDALLGERGGIVWLAALYAFVDRRVEVEIAEAGLRLDHMRGWYGEIGVGA